MLKRLYKVTSLPTSPEANALYFIQAGSNADLFVTDTSGVAKPVVTNIRIDERITLALAAQSSIEIVNTVADRDALTLTSNAMVLVLDATADSSVDAGGATYAYRHSDTSWNKIAEHESQDISLTWANIQNKPASSVTDLDDAVNKKHSHANLVELNKVGENAEGEMTYNSVNVNSWETVEW